MDDITKYLGTDIAGFILTFVSLHLLGARKRVGFLVGATSSISWGAFSWMAESSPTFVANCVFCAMNLRGYFKWRPDAPPSTGVVPPV